MAVPTARVRWPAIVLMVRYRPGEEFRTILFPMHRPGRHPSGNEAGRGYQGRSIRRCLILPSAGRAGPLESVVGSTTLTGK